MPNALIANYQTEYKNSETKHTQVTTNCPSHKLPLQFLLSTVSFVKYTLQSGAVDLEDRMVIFHCPTVQE